MAIVVLNKTTGLPIDPQVAPVEGDWVTNDINGVQTTYEYHEPVIILPTPIRQISVRAFLQRFTQTERTAMRASADDIITDIMEDLKMATYVDLDDPALPMGLGYANALGLIAAPQVTDLIIDGTEAEAYLGIL